jgi:hypothetical protein
MKRSLVVLVALVISICLTSQATAEEGHRHHAGVFVGATLNFEAKHTDFTLGADYEYRFETHHGFLGVGVIADFVFAKHTESLFMGGIFLHPAPSLKFVIGNGIAMSEVEKAGKTETSSHYVIRLGAGYDFVMSSMTITPTVNWDMIEGHSSLVYGLTAGFGF